MVFEFESLNNWLGTVNSFLAILSIIVTVLFFIRKKLYKTDFYKKIKSKIGIYHLKIIENKYLIGTVISASIIIILVFFALLSLLYLPPKMVSHTYQSQDFSPLQWGQGRIIDMAFNDSAILLGKGQLFWWPKGWGANAKLKSMKLSYYAPNETQIRVNLFFNNTDYRLSGKSTLSIGNISLPYQENQIYGMGILNIGEAPVYLFSIETEEEEKPTPQQILPYILIAYLLLIPLIHFRNKHKNRNITISPLDELYREAKLADRITNVKMELKNYQSSLRYLEELNFRKKLSPDFYSKKKEYFEEVIDILTKEKNNVDSEITDILNSRNE